MAAKKKKKPPSWAPIGEVLPDKKESINAYNRRFRETMEELYYERSHGYGPPRKKYE